MDTMFFYIHKAVQRRAVGLIGSCEEDKMFISLNLYKSTGRHRVNSSPIILDHIAKIAQADFPVKFSRLKQQLCDNNKDTNSEYEKLICEHLNNIGVREAEHPAILHKIFQVVEAAVSPVDAVVVLVSELTVSERNAIPASRTAIQGLERVTVIDIDGSSHTSCSICLEDFEHQEPITRLPCTHHFHINCIVQWLEVDHLCPLCRYPMPIEELQLIIPANHSFRSSLL
ncbi:PREDICTED: E3 ubiquitin-protein ligase RNF115-like isoform 2 [Fragaria vesca subsp. vesca]